MSAPEQRHDNHCYDEHSYYSLYYRYHCDAVAIIIISGWSWDHLGHGLISRRTFLLLEFFCSWGIISTSKRNNNADSDNDNKRNNNYSQRRQSGLKTGGVVDPGEKISIFSGNFTEIIDFSGQIS